MAALSEIEKLESRFRENPDGRVFAPLADAYRKVGRVDDALEVLTANLPKHPDYLSAHIVLGRCHLDKKDDPAARSAFERVLELDAENIIALRALAQISEREGDTDSARRWLMRLLQVDSMNVDAEADLGRLGGPLVEAAAAPAETGQDAAPFADWAGPDADTAPIPALDVELAAPVAEPSPEPAPAADRERTVEFVPPTVSPEADTEPIPALDLEPTALEPDEPAVAPEGITAFDDSLEWGSGERTSRAIHQEDLIEAERHHEATSAPIEFLEAAGAPAAAGEAPSEPEPRELEPISPLHLERASAPAGEWTAAPEASTIEMAPISVPEPPPVEAAEAAGAAAFEPVGAAPEAPPIEPIALPEPEPAAAGAVAEAGAAAESAGELPLIMPEDVTPPEEMGRPSAKQVLTVSPPPPAGESAEAGEPMLTETMAELYLKQGFTSQAVDVYRRLLAQRPDDEALRARLAALEAPRPVLSAAALGAESVGTFLRRIAAAKLPVAAPGPPPPAPEGPTPLEAAFASPPEEPAAQEAVPADVPGEPARPAADAFSLDQIFGAPAPASGPEPAPAAPAPGQPAPLGSSFDEFFGAPPPAEESVRPREAESPRASEDDLSAFNTWLHGLKR